MSIYKQNPGTKCGSVYVLPEVFKTPTQLRLLSVAQRLEGGGVSFFLWSRSVTDFGTRA